MPSYSVSVSMAAGTGHSGTLQVANEPSTTTLNALQAGYLITNLGATGAVVYTLPAASVGMRFKIFVEANYSVTINPPAGVTIQVGLLSATNGSGTAISTNIGDSTEVVCTGATTWVLI